MAAGGGDFQRALRLLLALDLAEVGVRGGGAARFAAILRKRRFAREVRDYFEQRARGQDVSATGERGLRGIAVGKHEGAPRCSRGERHGERTAHRTQLAGERKLTRELVGIERVRRELAARREDAERD